MLRKGLFTGALTVLSVFSLIVNPVASASATTSPNFMVETAPLFSESFTKDTLTDPTNWVLAKGSTSAAPCLTARDSASGAIQLAEGTQINGCATGALDPSPSLGALRLTNNSGGQSGTMQYVNALPTANGLDIQFKMAQYGGDGADGISFFLKDGNNTTNTPGASGGALGYAYGGATPGIPGGIFGIGFDRYGNFGGGSNSITVRGPDTSTNQDGTAGYSQLATTGYGAISFVGSDRVAAARLVRIAIDPATVDVPKIRIYFSDASGVLPSTPTLELSVPQRYFDVPTFKFGFSASTGGSTNNHEVWDLGINPAVPDTEPRMRCAGGGWYGGPKRTRGSFQFQVAQDKNGIYGGNVTWMLKGSSGNQETDIRFKGELTECRGNTSTNIATGTGEMFQKTGPGWQSMGIKNITITFTPTEKRNKKVIPGTVNFAISETDISSGGELGGGEVKVY